ncbi:MAG TPA: hypothetical protein VFU02_13025, partial [Polyangiaceae bacterium]|nr:hypothetical protein [Polyangiaceae bacterium]
FLVYGLGSGRGHATRAGALCAELARLGAEVRLLVSSGARAVLRPFDIEPNTVLEAEDPSERAWSRALERFEPTDCVVDTFPEGLYHEVDPSRCVGARWVALLRCRRDAQAPAFLASLARYAEVLDLEPALSWAPAVARPFGSVVRPIGAVLEQPATDVLLVATEARQRFFLENLAARLARGGVRTRCVPNPGATRSEAALLSGKDLAARVVVGPAGYNLTYELSALGVWHLALPAARQYDHQELRAERVAAVAHAPAAVERKVRAWLEQAAPRRPGDVRPMYELASALWR